MYRLHPPPARAVALDDVYGALDWPPPSADRPHVAVNMVASVDGRVSLGGSSDGLGSRTDRRLMRALRAHADAVLCGAGTLRAESFSPDVPASCEPARVARGLAPQPLGVVLSGSGRVPLVERYFGAAPDRRLIATTTGGVAILPAAVRARAQAIALGVQTVDLPALLRLLRTEHGVRWLLCEGGPGLNRGLLAAGLVDELFLTLAPRLLGGDAPTVVEGAALVASGAVMLELCSVYQEASELYLRYRVRPPAAPEREETPDRSDAASP